MKLSINEDNYLKLEAFEELLNKEKSQIINEALERYFKEEEKKIVEEDIKKEQAQTNLDYDEFWDGVDF